MANMPLEPASSRNEDFILSRNGGYMQLWNLASDGKLEHEFCPWQNQNPVCVAANYDGSMFAFGGKDILLRTPFGIPVAYATPVTQDSPPKTSWNSSTSLAFSDCSKYLFAGRESGKVHRICLQGKSELNYYFGHKSAVTGISLFPNDPSKLASVSLGGTLALHLVSGRRLALISDPKPQALLSICCPSLNKGDILTGSDLGITRLWSVNETVKSQSWPNKSGARISALAVSSSPSKFIITTSFDDTMSLIDERAKEIQQTLPFGSPLHSLAIRDGQYNVALGDDKGGVHVYDLRSGSTRLHFETSRVHDGQKAEPVYDLHWLDSNVLENLNNGREVSIFRTSLLEERGEFGCKRTPCDPYIEPDLKNTVKDYSQKKNLDEMLNKSQIALNETPTKTPVHLQNEASNVSFSFVGNRTSSTYPSHEAVESLTSTPHNATAVLGNHPVPPELSSAIKGGGGGPEFCNRKTPFVRNDLTTGCQTPSEWVKRRGFSQVPESADQFPAQLCSPSGQNFCPSTTISPSFALREVTNKKGSAQQNEIPFLHSHEQINALVQNLSFSPKSKQVNAEISRRPAESYQSPSVYSHHRESETSIHMESALTVAIRNASPERNLSLTSEEFSGSTQSEVENSLTNNQRNRSPSPVSSTKGLQKALNSPQIERVGREICSCGNQLGSENLILEAIKQLADTSTKEFESIKVGSERTEERISAVEGRINAMIFGLEKIFAKMKGLEENQHVLDHNFRVVSGQLRTLL